MSARVAFLRVAYFSTRSESGVRRGAVS
jgi:hypothetical protein